MTTNKVFVSGPVNAFRLEGPDKKIIYLFGDFHMDVTVQTSCDDDMSEEFNRYFTKTIKKAGLDTKTKDVKYDFFETTDNSPSRYGTSEYKRKYLFEIDKLFSKNINTVNDEKTKKIINKGAKYDPNLRLHGMDIRDKLHLNYFYADSIFNEIINIGLKNKCIVKQHITLMINTLHIIQKKVQMIKDIIFNDENKKQDVKKQDVNDGKQDDNNRKQDDETKKIQEQEENEKKDVEYYLDKIFNRYKNQTIKNKLLNKEIMGELHILISNIEKNSLLLHDMLNYMNTLENRDGLALTKYEDTGKFFYSYYKITYKTYLKKITELNTIIQTILSDYVNLYVLVTDIYMLRRFLDKDFITNAISYTGALHTINYIYILVKFFSYKITHSSYCKVSHEELENIIKNKIQFSCDCLAEYTSPYLLKQCSNLSSFPKLFQ